MHPFLSIIITAKNEEELIETCLKSLIISLSTWGGLYEIFLVDNGSTDSTVDIAISQGCKVLEAPGARISRLRNLGAEKAKGDILVFLDADCLVAPEWATLCLQKFDDQQIAVVGTRAIPDLNKATWVEKSWHSLFTGASSRKSYASWVGTSNLFIRRDVFIAVGGFDETLITAEDVNLCYRVAEEGYLIFLDNSVDTIHLRESKTLAELFRREYWRGKNSLTSYIINGCPKKELLSIAVPAVNLIALLALVPLLLTHSWLFSVPVITITGFPLLMLIRKRLHPKQVNVMLACYLVAFIYIIARSCALSMEFLSLLKGSKQIEEEIS